MCSYSREINMLSFEVDFEAFLPKWGVIGSIPLDLVSALCGDSFERELRSSRFRN
jgi:hypothetical protein